MGGLLEPRSFKIILSYVNETPFKKKKKLSLFTILSAVITLQFECVCICLSVLEKQEAEAGGSL